MRHGMKRIGVLCLLTLASPAIAQGQGPQQDVFKGKLFPPNIILEHQDALELSESQFMAIRSAVVEVQGAVAEHEWDLREAYQRVMSDLDESPVDAEAVMANVEKALLAENEVKKLQVNLLIELRNLLTDEQIEYLQSVR